jgi:hypothetical protein
LELERAHERLHSDSNNMPSGSMLVDLVLLETEIDIARNGRRWKRIIGQDSQVNLRARSHDERKGRVMSSEVELVSSIAIEPVPLKFLI